MVLTTAFLGAVAAVAAVYLGALVLSSILAGRRDRGRHCCGILGTLLTGLLGAIALAAVILVVGITATSVFSAILTGLLIAFVALSLLVSACLVKCLSDCAE